MNDSTIAVRYAKALFESARDKDILDDVRNDMELILKICLVPEFQHFLIIPTLKVSQKCNVLDELLQKDVQQITLSLLNLVFRNGRELYIQAIARHYIHLHKKYKGIRSAKITGAVEIPEALRTKIEKIIKRSLNAPIELQADHKSELIGGFILRIDDLQYDASLASSLKRAKKTLLN